jgi:hypothetical protein
MWMTLLTIVLVATRLVSAKNVINRYHHSGITMPLPMFSI